MSPINFFILSGTSGSGKTIALQMLEDLGFYCIDNLPASLVPNLAEQLLASKSSINNCAISIDSRNREFIDQLKTNFAKLSTLNIDYKLLFLDADDKVLIKRFSETRRKHPLSSKHVSLVEAISKERVMLEHISDISHRHINTSNRTPHELRSLIRNLAGSTGEHSLNLLFQSFGFKYGNPADADFVFDVRCLPNPHWQPELRPLTGLDQPVRDYLSNNPDCVEMAQQIEQFIEYWLPKFIADNRNYITIAIGCTGGKHRSVYLVDKIGQYFLNKEKIQTQVRHRELSL